MRLSDSITQQHPHCYIEYFSTISTACFHPTPAPAPTPTMATTDKGIMKTKIQDDGTQDAESVAPGMDTILADNLDDAILRANGHQSDMRRQFNWLSALGLGFSITNSWVGYLVSRESRILPKLLSNIEYRVTSDKASSMEAHRCVFSG